MTGLMPEIRADKNGKLVTRHVRNGNAANSSLGNVTVPSIKSEADEEAEQELISTLMQVTNEGWLGQHGVQRWNALKRVRTLPPSTVRAVSDKLERLGSGTYFGYVIAFALNDKQPVDTVENMTFFYNDDHYDSVMDYGADHLYTVIKGDIKGLDYYPQLTPGTNYLHADRSEQDKAKMLFELLKPADELEKIKTITDPSTGERAAILGDNELVELALENSDNSAHFLDLVDERGMNAETLREILTTTAPLWDGAL